METVAQELQKVPLFSALSQRQLKKLARNFREREIKAGTCVIREGEKGGVSFFVIVDGTATASVGGNEVSRLGPGDHFGDCPDQRAGPRRDGHSGRTDALPRHGLLGLPAICQAEPGRHLEALAARRGAPRRNEKRPRDQPRLAAMSQENVEVLRRYYEAYAQDGFEPWTEYWSDDIDHRAAKDEGDRAAA